MKHQNPQIQKFEHDSDADEVVCLTLEPFKGKLTSPWAETTPVEEGCDSLPPLSAACWLAMHHALTVLIETAHHLEKLHRVRPQKLAGVILQYTGTSAASVLSQSLQSYRNWRRRMWYCYIQIWWFAITWFFLSDKIKLHHFAVVSINAVL